jgi:hypothetical protein
MGSGIKPKSDNAGLLLNFLRWSCFSPLVRWLVANLRYVIVGYRYAAHSTARLNTSVLPHYPICPAPASSCRRSDQEVFFVHAALFGGSHHPARHATTPGPGVLGVLGITILDGDCPAPALPAQHVVEIKA